MCSRGIVKQNKLSFPLRKMGSIATRAGIEPTSLAFREIMLTITPPKLPDVTTLTTPTLSERSVQTITSGMTDLRDFSDFRLNYYVIALLQSRSTIGVY